MSQFADKEGGGMAKRKSDGRQLEFDFVTKPTTIGGAVLCAMNASLPQEGSVAPSTFPRLVWVSDLSRVRAGAQLSPDSAEVTSMIRNAAKAIGW